MSEVRVLPGPLLMKRIIYALFAVLIVASIGIIFRDNIRAVLFPVKVVHYHAGFQVYENGKLKSFADIRYMHDKPCTGNPSPEELYDPMEKAHLHDLVGDVVHVHRENVVWGDLFTNLKYPVDESNAEAYINGHKVSGLLSYPIKSYDSLVLFIGTHGDVKQYIANEVTKAHIQEVEHRSETCGKP
jgi:hypothetical protein